MACHTFVYNGKDLYGFGENTNGQLGTGGYDFSNKLIPTLIMKDTSIKKIACGSEHTLLLKKNGKLYSSGLNDYGQSYAPVNIKNINGFTLIIHDNSIKHIYCSGNSSFIIKKHSVNHSNSLHVFGSNNYGQLGVKNVRYINNKIGMTYETNIKFVASGNYHTFIYKKTGELYAVGRNDCGQLGLGDNISRNVFTLVMFNTNIKQISCGFYHSLLLLNSGLLFVTGSNDVGQLGLGNSGNKHTFTQIMDNVSQIACGAWFSVALHISGHVYSFGYNKYGNLGIGNDYNKNIPTIIPFINNIRYVICGSSFTLALNNYGQLYAFGNNNSGQLGTGNNYNMYAPKLIMDDPTITLINNVRVDKIIWKPDIYRFINPSKQLEILTFILICHHYKKYYNVAMVKYMINLIINSLF